MLEAIILKYLWNKDNFIRYYPHLEKLTLEPELQKLFNLLPMLHEGDGDATLNEMKILFDLEYPSIKDPQIYASIFKQLEKADISDVVCGKLVDKLIYKDINNRIIQACMPVLSDSDGNDTLAEVRELLDGYEQMLMPDAEEDIFVTDDLEYLLEKKIRGEGIKWRLAGLNKDIGDLRGGKLGHVFARPDTGKTTFLISEMSFWAPQLEQNEIGIWVNNEEDGEVLKLRWYSAITGWPIAAINAQPQRAVQFYNKQAGSRIKLFDRSASDRDLESLIKRYKPRFMVIDQGDKVKSYTHDKMSETARLGSLYAGYREWAKKYGLDILTVGQAHADAERKKWLLKSWMNNSKTEKPGELDYAIGIGVNETDNDLDRRRYFHICKNKQGPHGSFTAMIDPEKARYFDT